MKTSTSFALPFFYALMMSSCSNSADDYPKNYIGFEQANGECTYDASQQEQTLTLKIIAGEKQEKDRKLKLGSSLSGYQEIFKFENANPVMEKGKKSLKVNIVLYPPKINQYQRVLTFTCLPDGKDAKISAMTIRLQKK